MEYAMRFLCDGRLRFVEDVEYDEYNVGTSETVGIYGRGDGLDEEDYGGDKEVMGDIRSFDDEEGGIEDSVDDKLDNTASIEPGN